MNPAEDSTKSKLLCPFSPGLSSHASLSTQRCSHTSSLSEVCSIEMDSSARLDSLCPSKQFIEKAELFELQRATGPMRKVFILDCRSAYEYQGGHIRDAFCMDFGAVSELFFESPELLRSEDFVELLRKHAKAKINFEKMKFIVKCYRKKNLSSISIEKQLEFPQNSMNFESRKPMLSCLFGLQAPSASAHDFKIPKKAKAKLSVNLGNASSLSVSRSLKLHNKTPLIESSDSSPSTHEKLNCRKQSQAFDTEDLTIILYCEFSSKRAPNMYHLFRSKDRESNFFRYPFVQYPNVRVLRGGYLTFVSTEKHMCESFNGNEECYVSMLNFSYPNNLSSIFLSG